MKKTYDPMLRLAMADIQAIMKKYDCAGYVALASRSHFEFRMQPEASWSFIKLEPCPDGQHAIRIKIKGKADGRRAEMADASVGFIFNLRDNLKHMHNAMDALCTQLNSMAQITHNPPPISNDDREMEDQP